MSIETTTPSRYDRRVTLVQAIVQEHSKLNEKKALELAVHMVRALDTIPETLR